MAASHSRYYDRRLRYSQAVPNHGNAGGSYGSH